MTLIDNLIEMVKECEKQTKCDFYRAMRMFESMTIRSVSKLYNKNYIFDRTTGQMK